MDIISSKSRESYLHHSAIDENMVMFGCSSSESVVVGALAFVINETIAEPVKVESEKIEIFSPPTFSGRIFKGVFFSLFNRQTQSKYAIIRRVLRD